MSIARLFDFIAGTKIKSADVDAELNNLVAGVNANETAINARYTKTEIDSPTRDHKGTWQGYTPNMIGDAILSQRIQALENSKVTVTRGASTFNGTVGTIITHTIGTTNYDVVVTPTANPNGYLGEVWVVKANNNFKVCNSGTAVTAFSYMIIV